MDGGVSGSRDSGLAIYLAPLENPADGRHGAVMILRDVTQERDHAAEIVESERLNAILMLAAPLVSIPIFIPTLIISITCLTT